MLRAWLDRFEKVATSIGIAVGGAIVTSYDMAVMAGIDMQVWLPAKWAGPVMIGIGLSVRALRWWLERKTDVAVAP